MKPSKIRRKNRVSEMRRSSAFTLTEALISLLILGILGVAVLVSMTFLFSVFSQTSDHVAAGMDIGEIYRELNPQFSNIGLGMPNNRSGNGSFAESFFTAGNDPIMAQMGELSQDWGGPVTLANGLDFNLASKVTSSDTVINGQSVYAGPILYYAWSMPTGVFVNDEGSSRFPVVNGERMDLRLASPDAVDFLQKFKSCGYEIGLTNPTDNDRISVRRWITFPTLRVPMWVSGWNNKGSIMGDGDLSIPNSLAVMMAPGSRISFSRIHPGFEEIHLVRAARLYVNQNKELVQEIFASRFQPEGSSDTQRKILARNISAIYFTFNPQTRLLTMYVASRGMDSTPLGKNKETPFRWPSVFDNLPEEDLKYRIMVKTLTWRIRN